MSVFTPSGWDALSIDKEIVRVTRPAGELLWELNLGSRFIQPLWLERGILWFLADRAVSHAGFVSYEAIRMSDQNLYQEVMESQGIPGQTVCCF